MTLHNPLFNTDKIMKSKIFTLVLTLMALIPASMASAQQNPLSSRQAKSVLSKVIAGYSDWGRVELNGKISSSILPVSASAKIYMEKGKLIMISLRAPFVGEVGRVEINTDSLLIVNKMHKKYFKASMSSIDEIYPGSLIDLQSILLGRLAVMGTGTIRQSQFSALTIYEGGEGGYFAIPTDSYQPETLRYGYTIDSSFKMTTLMVTPVDADDVASVTYQWGNSGNYIMEINAMRGSRTFDAELDIDTPSFGASPMKPFQLPGKYKRVGRLRDVLR